MSPEFLAVVHHFLYASGATFGPIEVSLRTAVVYFAAIAIVRVGKKKFMGQHTGFDTLIAFILGSVLSRGINGSAPLFPTIVSGFALILLHWALTVAALYSPFLDRLMNGRTHRIVKDGIPLTDKMHEHGIGEEELEQAMRFNGHVGDVSQVHAAFFERSGHISILPRKKQPRILEVIVQDGVQKIRIELD